MRSRRRLGKWGRCRFRIGARWRAICATPLRRRTACRRCSCWMQRWNWLLQREGVACRWSSFVAGNRKTARRTDEILAAVLVPRRMENAASAFLKLGARRYLVISISMVAAVVQADEAGPRGGGSRSGGIVFGQGAAVGRFGRSTSSGVPAKTGIGAAVKAEHLSSLSPIDDVRATADYRRDASLTLVRRALEACVGSR